MFNRIKVHIGFMLVFSFVIALIILGVYWFINSYVLRAYEKAMIANSEQLNAKIAQQVDLYFNDLSQLSRNSVANRNLMDDMRQLDKLTHELTQYETLFFDRSFESYSSYLINSSDFNTSKVYIFGRKNRFKFSYGPLLLESNFEKVYNSPAYRKKLESSSVLYIRNENRTDGNAPPSISSIRPFAEISGDVLGYIEVQQDYSRIAQIANLGKDGEAFIFDSDRRVIYPPLRIEPSVMNLLERAIAADGNGFVHGNYYYTARYSETSGLTTVIKHSDESVFKSLYTLQNTTLLLVLTILSLSVSAIYTISLRMTAPIRKLRSGILKVDFDNFQLFMNRKSPSNEMNMLNDAFQQMMERLKQSMKLELQSREKESKARFSALQSQMAPHFIHNILYLISISAQERRHEDVIAMCKKLSDMLRYLADSPWRPVKLEEEIQYTMNYLSLIQCKYEDFVDFAIDVRDTAYIVELPRLTIQPFVENAIQHAFGNINPPWKVSIDCSGDRFGWEIVIRDNGAGIAEERKLLLERQIAEILLSGTFEQPSGIGGMGILNTVMRLRMLYPNTLRIALDNGKEGLSVSIRGADESMT
ncbi:cache domain-containing sensor histidine kinase [Cohnella lupini]|uniref:Two-component system sensor histidine kinase YesM n=1 Tax=Cohnella lupini TaxID=1294267 RepID=A0A3D9I0T7_9BACL|nr:sensor histidine kinase [Cohnella lupini]RED55295.1 two-component system sensor histidine kinase YesM [Cohnella lupini]